MTASADMTEQGDVVRASAKYVRGAVETVRFGHRNDDPTGIARAQDEKGRIFARRSAVARRKNQQQTLEATAAPATTTASSAPAAAPPPIHFREPLFMFFARQVHGQFVRRRRLDPT